MTIIQDELLSKSKEAIGGRIEKPRNIMCRIMCRIVCANSITNVILWSRSLLNCRDYALEFRVGIVCISLIMAVICFYYGIIRVPINIKKANGLIYEMYDSKECEAEKVWELFLVLLKLDVVDCQLARLFDTVIRTTQN